MAQNSRYTTSKAEPLRYLTRKRNKISIPVKNYWIRDSHRFHTPKTGLFINVTGNKSPYDGDVAYWSERNSKLYDDHTSRALKRQNHTCGHCGLKCISDERVHLHHRDGNHSNWKNNNLVAIHEFCHDYIHMGKREQQP